MNFLEEHFPEFAEKMQELDGLCTEKKPLDDKTYEMIRFALSVKGRSGPCVRKHFRGALDAGATMRELSFILALTMRESAGADDCWTRDVLGDVREYESGTKGCGCC